MKIFILVWLISSTALANLMECAIQTRDSQGTSSGDPQSFGTMETIDDEIWTEQEGYKFWANKMSDNSVGVVITDTLNKVTSNAIGASVNWDFYTVMAQSGEGDGNGRSGTILCRTIGR